MAVSEDYRQAVKTGNTLRVRLMLKNSFILDPTGVSFDEMFDYAKSNIDGLVVEHDGEIFKNQSEWNEEYYNEQTVKVMDNFSEERLNLLKDMAGKIFEASEQKDSSVASTVELPDDIKNKNTNNTKILGGGVLMVGAALLIGGLVIDTSIVIPVIGGASIIAGTYLILKK